MGLKRKFNFPFVFHIHCGTYAKRHLSPVLFIHKIHNVSFVFIVLLSSLLFGDDDDDVHTNKINLQIRSQTLRRISFIVDFAHSPHHTQHTERQKR